LAKQRQDNSLAPSLHLVSELRSLVKETKFKARLHNRLLNASAIPLVRIHRHLRGNRKRSRKQ
jgi:hypothetical protein